MLRIGELAQAAGTTTRAVRHYHALGLLPEPERRPNGYREYDARALVRLVRIRRLVGLGLSLPEVADALAGDDDRGLREVMAELVGDLARREHELRAQRERLTALLDREHDLLLPEALAGLVDQLREVAVPPHLVAREQELLELLEATMPPEQFDRLGEVYRAALADPEQVARGLELSHRFEALACRDPADPAVAELARTLAEHGAGLVPEGAQAEPGPEGGAAWTAYLSTLGPAQQRCLELAQAELGR